MKYLIGLLVVFLSACAPLSQQPDTKANYSGRDFTAEDPNAGFPSLPVESAGDAAGSAGE